jgi:opacity protein-like surface antigen
MVSHRRLLLGAGLLTLAIAHPLHAQRVQDWQYRWYWGVQGGMIGYTMPTSGRTFTPTLGAEWLITQRRVALYLGYVQSFKTEIDTFSVIGLTGSQQVQFDGYRQIQINVVAFIGDKALQPYVGGGFVLVTLTNANQPGNTSNTVADAINDAASGGFLQVMGGAQYRFAQKGALFAHYQYTPQGRDFLLTGGAHTISGGVRWAFLGSKENDPTTRR